MPHQHRILSPGGATPLSKQSGCGPCGVGREGGNWFYIASKQIRSHHDEIETRNREEIRYSLRIVPKCLSVAEAPGQASTTPYISIATKLCELGVVTNRNAIEKAGLLHLLEYASINAHSGQRQVDNFDRNIG